MTLPTAIIRHDRTGRWHPIVFRPTPLPGGKDSDMGVRRYKSLGHHTEGFLTLEEAQAHIATQSDWGPPGAVYGWNGEDSPSMTVWLEAPR